MEAPFSISASQGAIRCLPMKLELVLSRPKHELRAKERKKLRRLKTDLQGLIDNYLIEPSEVVSPASTAHSWMKGVCDLSYDIDDFIYELAHFVAGGARISVVQKPRRFKIKIRFLEKLRRRQWITDEISAFRTRIKEAIRRYTEYLGSNCKWRPSSSAEPTPSPSSEAANQLVGVESSIQHLCSLLANDGLPEHRVVSIVGTGGVGKTTLAREVYRKLGGQFQCLAFVRTPPKQDMKGLLTSILSQVQRRRHITDDALDVHKLVLNINAHLQDKTYLIVIEDLWALSTWNLVNRALPKGICCSRILTTTEIDLIARACCADNSKCNPAKKENNSMYIIKKELLREDESSDLFSNRSFGKQAECPQGVKEVLNEIIKRSGGLPLGINILAGLLAHHPASSIEQLNYIQNSLSSDLTTHAISEKINQVLNIGYDNLPHYLKACILYLCMYEEDCIIWKDELVKQWIAEGFISALEGEDKEEVARSYFGELVNRGMIQPVDINCNDEILSCRVHHMVLHFIRDKCMDENFCIAVDHSQTSTRFDKVRRLALHWRNVEHAKPPGAESMRLSKVRSIAFSGFLKFMPSIVEFRFLKVLNLKLLVDPDNMMSHNLTGFDDQSGNLAGCDDLSGNLTGSDDLSGNISEPNEWTDSLSEPDGLSYNLTGISELCRLRYFRLDACHLSVELPAQMQQLKDLMAWEIDAEVTSVPSDIVDLPGLLYLRIPREAHLPTGFGRMTSLRTLGVFDLSKNSSEDVMSLGELTSLQDLRLACSTLQPDNLEKNLECLGSVIRKLSNLKCVTLVPSVSSHVNTQNDAGAPSMSTSWHGLNIVPLPPALLQRLELSRRCCIFSSLPQWINEFTKLRILKIALRRVSTEDVVILKGLPLLTALSLFIWTAPARRIIFDNEGFSVLKYFKFVCAAPCLEFLEGAMPNVKKLKLGFNANRMDRIAGLKRLTGLNEISIQIGDTGAVQLQREPTQSVLTDAIGMDPSTPIINVQWVDWSFCGEDEKHTEPREEIQDHTSEQQNVTAGECSDLFIEKEAKPRGSALIDAHIQVEDGHGIQEKNLEEDAKKQPDIRTYGAPESTFRLQNAGFPGIEQGRAMEYLSQKMSSSDPQPIKLHLLKTITEDFSEKMKIGSGGYGDVYKGMLNGDEIAVKKLFPIHGVDDRAFENEFRNIKKVQHKNVIRMIGYCYEIAHRDVEYQGKLVWSTVIDRAICFEYMKGGSLANHISAESCIHDWPTTYKIISGTCKGLHHLHKGGEQMIFHLDLKPDNVLLDDEMVPKIGDFGLSKLFGSSYTHKMSSQKGTIGFMPPEYIHNCKVSPKNDVFSLGVIIFHMMAGEKGYGNYWDARRRPNFSKKVEQDFTESVQEYWKTKMEATVSYRWDETDVLGVTKCIEIAMRCVEDDRVKRPSTTQIQSELKELESKIEEMLKEDPKPFMGQLVQSELKELESKPLMGQLETTNDFSEERKIVQGGYGHAMEYVMEKMSSSDPQPIKMHLLKTITEDFSQKMKIGSGGYGEVFKGVLNGDEFAVKKLFPVHGFDDKAFENEFRHIKKVQHKNVIRMIGYCYEIAHRDVEYEGKLVWAQVIDRALCFEYMKEGSLANHISAESCIHDWPTTYKIISGTCEGLHHLHKGEKEHIFHLDLKPENVLLDEELVPKIGDFGLSRLFGTSYTHQISTMKGTIGFMPQEYIKHRMVSLKNDVFSLGVIIFYMMAGAKGYVDYWDKRSRSNFSPKIQQDFIESVQEYWKTKMESTMSYRWDGTDVLGVTKCIEMAMRCVEDDRKIRPSITEILGELKELDSKIEGMLKEDPKPLTRQQKGKNHVNDLEVLPAKKNDLEVLKQNQSPHDLGKYISVNPYREVRFPFEPNREASCCLELINKEDRSFVAFNIKMDPNKYRAHPHSGILPPRSKCYIILTLQAQKKGPPNMACHDEAIVQTTRAPEGFISDNISKDFLKNASSVDEVTLPIVYVALEKPLPE